MGHIRALRCGVISASNGFVVSVVVKGTVSGSAVRRRNSRASHVGVMAGAVITRARSKCSVTGGGGCGDGGNFRIAKLVVALLALPELVAGTLGVAVGRTGTEPLLLLVVTAKKNLDRNGEQEEEAKRLLAYRCL